MFLNLEKVVVVDDDVVVPRDLASLSLRGLCIGGKVNGAVQACESEIGSAQELSGR